MWSASPRWVAGGAASAVADALAGTTATLDLTSQTGAKATFELRLVDGSASPLAGKKLQLVDGSKVLSTVKTDAAGRGAKTVKLKAGAHAILARFKGDRAFAAADSATEAVTISKPELASPASGATASSLRPTLEWAAVAGASSYRVHLQPSSGAPAELTVAGTSVATPALVAGKRYRWSVVAVLETGESLRSSTRTFKVPGGGGGNHWTLETVEGDHFTGLYPSIAVDSAALPHVVYRDDDTDTYRLAERGAGGTWTFADVGSSAGPYTSGRRSGIAIDGLDRVHLTWFQADVAYLYERRDGGTVAVGPAPIGGGKAYAFLGYVSIGVSTGGTPFVAAQSYGLVAVEDETLGGWSGSGGFAAVEVGSVNEPRGRYCSVAMSPNGMPRVAYQAQDATLETGSRLRYASWNGASWDIETVTTGLQTTSSSGNNWENGISLAVDGQDRPRIVYLVDGTYRYVDRDGGTWASADLGDTVYGSFGAASVAVGPGGDVHVALMATSDNLRHAVRSGGKWTFEQVDTVGLYPSIAIDAAGGVHVAYHDDGNGDLKYAHLGQ